VTFTAWLIGQVLVIGFLVFLSGDNDRLRRHVEELARAKAVFEAGNNEPS
jgi:hypothetical protein